MSGVRDNYSSHCDGADGWYRDEGSTYENPHADAVNAMVRIALQRWPECFGHESRMLDLCAGSGEVFRSLRQSGIEQSRIDASDPYTASAFSRHCRRDLDATWSFADIERGTLSADKPSGWATVWCSYALHLCETSRLPSVCIQLAHICSHLLVITPHKRPEIDDSWGLMLVDEHRDPAWRVRLRRYDSTSSHSLRQRAATEL